jgi:hypothetical protein
MARLVLTEVLLTLAVFAGVLMVLAVVFRAQVRWYNRTVATDLLDDWWSQLELLSEEDRKRALADPPPNVVAAMVGLPSRGLRSGWTDRPMS